MALSYERNSKYLFLFAVHALNKLPYSKLDSKSVGIKEGVVFLTYSSLIASSEKGRSRLQQLVQWCGSGFDGLVIFDEVYLISFGIVLRCSSLHSCFLFGIVQLFSFGFQIFLYFLLLMVNDIIVVP